MEYILMNKNIEVLTGEYNNILKGFDKIIKIININYAPLIIKNTYYSDIDNLSICLTNWFKGRGIPDLRDDLDLLLSKLNVNSPLDLLDKAYALSLSDQYWIKPIDSDVKWEDINFFNHDFKDIDFSNATFSNNYDYSTKINLLTPNNTTDGVLKKTWIMDNKDRYLLKGSYKNDIKQPFNEVLGSMISDRLGFNHVKYELSIVHNKVVSKCKCFINENTELIPAYQVLYNNCDKDNAYEDYVRILEENGITNVKEKLNDMFLLDYIILNEDRHLNNFGIIRDVNTLKWIDVCPLFDNGQSLNIKSYEDEIIIDSNARYFYKVIPFDNLLKHITNIDKYNFNKLDGVIEWFDSLLHKYQEYTHISDEYIYKLCVLLQRRIDYLKSLQGVNNGY